jgi:hypothetical protein
MQIKKIWLINFLKIFVVILLLWWMAASGRLSWEQLIIVLRRPDVLVMSLAVWCGGLFCWAHGAGGFFFRVQDYTAIL